MGFIGFFPLNGTAFGYVCSENASAVPSVPDALPTFRVYGSSATPVASGTTSAFDAANLNYVYKFSFNLDGGFARGSNYHVVVSYDIGSQTRERIFCLSVY